MNYDDNWIKQLRSALDAGGYENTRIVAADVGNWDVVNSMLDDPELASAIDVVGAHYPGNAPQNASWLRGLGKSLWASEMWDLQVRKDRTKRSVRASLNLLPWHTLPQLLLA